MTSNRIMRFEHIFPTRHDVLYGWPSAAAPFAVRVEDWIGWRAEILAQPDECEGYE